MPKKMDERTMKLKLLSKIIEAGYSDEQAISAMSTVEMIEIPNVTVTEIAIICELQKSIKDRRIIAWLSGKQMEGLSTEKPKKERPHKKEE